MRWVLLLLVAVLMLPSATVAQTPTAVSQFPTPLDLGSEGWEMSVGPPTVAWQGVTSMQAAGYFGPRGSRVLIFAANVEAGTSGTRQAWASANEAFDAHITTFRADAASETALADEPAVAGCADMRRIEGTELIFTEYPIGMSLCATDSDLIVFAYVSGLVAGEVGPAASDHVVALTLAANQRN